MKESELYEKCEKQPMDNIPDSSCGKMSMEHFIQIGDMILELSSKKSQKPIFQCLVVEDGRAREWLEAINVKLRGESSTLNYVKLYISSIFRSTTAKKKNLPCRRFWRH